MMCRALGHSRPRNKEAEEELLRQTPRHGGRLKVEREGGDPEPP